MQRDLKASAKFRNFYDMSVRPSLSTARPSREYAIGTMDGSSAICEAVEDMSYHFV